jgi:speckle-type POZ protein
MDVHVSATTTLAPHPRVTFKWRIHGVTPAFFTGAFAGAAGGISSPAFPAIGREWRLELFPNGDSRGANRVGLFLSLRSPNCARITPTVTLQLGLASAKFDAKTLSTMEPQPADTVRDRGFPNLIGHDVLLAAPSTYFPGGVLTLSAIISLTENTLATTSAVEENNDPLPAIAPTAFLSEMASLLTSGEGADVTLLCGADRMHAHANILCARSPVLRAQLRGPMACPPNAVPVPDEIDPPTLRRTLTFIYTDECEPASAEEAQHLLNAADHFGLARLRAICERKLADALNVENAAFTLTLAEQHSASGLRTAALRFVAKNAVEVTKTEGWAHLKASSPALVEAALLTSATGVPPEPQVAGEAADKGKDDEHQRA